MLRRFANVIETPGAPDLAQRIAKFGLTSSPPPRASPADLAQAYSTAFALLNAVEENAAVQYRRAREDSEHASPEPGLWQDCLSRLKASDMSAKQIANSLADVRVEPVLTLIPPRQSARPCWSLHRELYMPLVRRENPIWTKRERTARDADVEAVLDWLWRTGNIFLRKPGRW